MMVTNKIKEENFMTKENKFLKGLKNPGLIVGLVFLAVIIIVGAVLFLNYNNNKDYDDSVYTPIPVSEKDIVKSPRENIIDSYNNNKETFDKAIEFLANKQTQYTINAVLKNGVESIDISPEITDTQIKGAIEKIINDLSYKSAFSTFSLSPDDMSVWILFDGKEGSYQRGLVFFKKDESKKSYATNTNEIWEFNELAPKTYFYYNHFDKVLHEDVFRNISWNALSPEQKDSATLKKDLAIIRIVKVKDPKTGQNVDAISLIYSTNKPGFGNNLKVYIDGKTKKVIKITTAGEEMFGL